MSGYFYKDGTPIKGSFEDAVLEWGNLMKDRSYSDIGKTIIGDVKISTVWLGLNHNWDGGDPLIFETMIFGGEHDEYQERYSTEQQAKLGHQYAVDLVKDRKPKRELKRESSLRRESKGNEYDK